MDGSDVLGTDENDSIILEDETETGECNCNRFRKADNSADKIVGSGTKFLSELKIGDQISFEDDSNTTLLE